MLYLAQEQSGNWVTLAAMNKIAKILDMTEIEVYEVASFYSMFNREPVGKFHLQVCGTTPCMVCGARDIIKTIEKECGIVKGQTSKDGLFTLTEVECLGACANAPMMQINNQYVYEDLTPETTKALLDKFRAGETPKFGPQNGRKVAEGRLGKTTLKTFPGVYECRDFEKVKEEVAAAAKAAAEAAAAKAAADAAAQKK